ncbi:MAG: xanthine dehydrogenase family protein subunit M [Thermoanaerobacteraceae bacterium]|nr:xanthine dehydrogenase family protein subunit M [Thermoanaerobacteraceae bacterium]
MAALEYIKPTDSIEAYNILKNNPGAKVIAGGTDLMVMMRNESIKPECIVDIKGIEATHILRFDENGLYIGASCTANEVMNFGPVKEYYPGLYDALKGLATYQVRNRATVVGNLCNASPAADTAPVLLAMGAYLDIQGPAVWQKPLLEFFTGVKKNSLSQGEFVQGLTVPRPEPGEKSIYYKKGRIKGADLSIVGVAGVFSRKGKLRIGLGSVYTTPVLVVADDLLDKDDLKDRLVERVLNSINPITDTRASREYRIDMTRYYTFKVAEDLMREASI